MKTLYTVIAIILVSSVPQAVSAQQYGEWYIEENNRTGILARVKGGMFARREFMVAFEYDQRCQPIFSSVEMNGRAFGTFVRKEAFPPQRAFLSVNGQRYTWHGAYAEYSDGVEIGIGIIQSAWNALLSNPRTISFTEPDGGIYDVPVGGVINGRISNILQQAANLCVRRLR